MQELIWHVQKQFDIKIDNFEVIYKKNFFEYFLLYSEERKFFLKNFGSNNEKIQEELNKLSLFNQLDYGIFCIEDRYHQPIIAYNGKYYLLFPYIERGDANATHYGNASVRFWNVINASALSLNKVRDYRELNWYYIYLDKAENELKRYYSIEKLNYLICLGKTIKLPEYKETHTIIHGDMNLNNILGVNDSMFFIDYEDLCMGDIYSDIATMIISMVGQDLLKSVSGYIEEIEKRTKQRIDYEKLENYIQLELARSITVILNRGGILLRFAESRMILERYFKVMEYLLPDVINATSFQL